MMGGVDTRLLRVLVELSDRGTLRAVAEATGYGTSAVSQQLATLTREVGAPLVERTGRTVRLTPAGRRLVTHARPILAAVDAARAALARGGEPGGAVHVAAYASVLSGDLIPVVRELAVSHPGLQLLLQEREPPEVVRLLEEDEVDLGFVYDYDLVPRGYDGYTVRQLCETPMVLAVPAERTLPDEIDEPGRLCALAGQSWVVNSRGPADDELAVRVCALAAYQPMIEHRADSMDLVLDLVSADLGVALVPGYLPEHPGVRYVPMPGVPVRRRMFSITRPGREHWPAVSLVIERVAAHALAERWRSGQPLVVGQPGDQGQHDHQ
ncbi:LysR family transcriptional regulator [Catellatospora citrea]|uniref:LysR family transcriptional regulator n=1 Tax=Catellatospora citrea TaxID=53366 RepID=A0A8J3KSA3_9ACTN|nr:LysR family transcriptional regulator [Catellatospora citrea]GIG01060.1 LysR family transcriptional regulator [Catellatospora citrea]